MAYILVIDDSELALEFTKEMLLEAGHTVNVTPDPAQFMAWASGQPTPDLVIVDSVMPEIQGPELIAQLRASSNPQLASIPVILASALDDATVPDPAVLLLPKPFDAEDLNNTINFALK